MSDTISSKKLLETVLDQILEGFQVIDKDWKYLYVNEVVAKQGKKTKEELIGKTMMEAYPGIEKTPLFMQLQKAMKDKVSIEMENEFKFPDSTQGWFKLLIHPWENGIMIFSLDITELKIAQQELYDKILELDSITKIVVNREIRMVELKEKISYLQNLIPSNEPRVLAA